jgi:DUF4097 and DUF4098 domain-containing protein YvlB
MSRQFLMGAVLAMAVMGAVATPVVRADDWSKTYQVSGHANLHVSTDDGDVTMIGADQKQIDAHVTTQGYKLSPSEVKIEESQTGDLITISVKLPHLRWSWGMSRKSVKIELHVPRDLDVDVRTGDGNVTAQNVSGRVQFTTGDGNVTASAVHGEIHLHTGDGHIEGTDFDGGLDATTGDGNLRVSGRFDSLALKTGDGNIEGQIGSGSKVANTWTIHSGDGHINLRIPPDLNANIDVHTGDGSITMDVPVLVAGSLSHSSVHGKLNAGGETISVSSGDGSIHLEKL